MNYDEIKEYIVEWFLDVDSLPALGDLYYWIRSVCDESLEKRAATLLQLIKNESCECERG